MNTKKINTQPYGLLIIFLMLIPFVSSAQENEIASVSYFSNALFNTLLIVIILLAILISALSGVMKNIINSEMFLKKLKKRAEQNKDKKIKGLAIFFILMSLSSYAGDGVAKTADGRIGGIDMFTFYAMLSVILLEAIFISVLIFTISSYLKGDEIPVVEAPKKQKEKTILDKFISDAVEIENEESVLLDHDYDGIKELDNNLPPWWKYGFYLTIIVAVLYLINYHVTGSSPLQAEEYNISIKKAEAEIAEFMKTSANNVDESSVKMLDSPADLSAGKDIFLATCSACHGKFGEGTVGPNLTDDYWLHSGSIKDIFKTIKYGYPDKGMKSWKEDYSPIQIAQVTSYIRTLRGTNPPKPKDKQGDLYIEEIIAAVDSTGGTTDSTKVNAGVDSLLIKMK